jgi:hypothetical protein
MKMLEGGHLGSHHFFLFPDKRKVDIFTEVGPVGVEW